MDKERDSSQVMGTSNEAESISLRRNTILFWDAGACSGHGGTLQIVAALGRGADEWGAESHSYESQGCTLGIDEKLLLGDQVHH